MKKLSLFLVVAFFAMGSLAMGDSTVSTMDEMEVPWCSYSWSWMHEITLPADDMSLSASSICGDNLDPYHLHICCTEAAEAARIQCLQTNYGFCEEHCLGLWPTWGYYYDPGAWVNGYHSCLIMCEIEWQHYLVHFMCNNVYADVYYFCTN